MEKFTPFSWVRANTQVRPYKQYLIKPLAKLPNILLLQAVARVRTGWKPVPPGFAFFNVEI
jgi:hypothetical protein